MNKTLSLRSLVIRELNYVEAAHVSAEEQSLNLLQSYTKWLEDRNKLMLIALRSAERAMSNPTFAAEVLAEDSAVRTMIRGTVVECSKPFTQER